MHINLVIFRSELHDRASVMNMRTQLISSMEKIATVTIMDSTDYTPDSTTQGFTVSFIATGGTEQKFSDIADKLPSPVILMCDGFHNSLAATFEIATWLTNNGKEYELINIPSDYRNFDFLTFKLSCIELKSILLGISPIHLINQPETNPIEDDLSRIYDRDDVSGYLKKSVVGLIGGESSWLIASSADTEYLSDRFGTSFINIDIGEVISNYLSLPDDILLEQLPEGYPANREKEIREALKLCRVFEDLCTKYSLTAFTVKCFDLIETCRTTACLALSLLNDKGIIAGCEGDIPALWTMMIAHAITGKSSFMANPSAFSEEISSIDFAHCTVPLSMTEKYTLPTHFESGIGVGIAGVIKTGPCSIFKIGGHKLDKMFLCSGTITSNTKIFQRCRTQIRITIEDHNSFDRFFANRLGNHVIICPTISLS